MIVGRSSIVGKPMSLMLLAKNATISVAHSHTDPRELARICQSADILVAACGIPKMIKGPWIKPGAAVIDVGMDAMMPAGSAVTSISTPPSSWQVPSPPFRGAWAL